jgi:hypothetical protein
MATVSPQWKTKIPSNMNPLAPTGFKFSINKLPKLQFYSQSVNLPGIILGEPSFGTPYSRIPIPGEQLTFDDLRIQFLVDETMENYQAIQNWLFALGFPKENAQYTNFTGADQVTAGPNSELSRNYSDASLFILTNNNTESKIVSFKNCFPSSLESLTFTGIDNDVQYLVGNVTFKYSYYEFA